ncbi:hypothetical protein DVA67_013455 [Solirubrobacter sp. CPCC 204708]|uniref:Cardiolipin synthase N-terminal domain-containing protein n=1 Tax=Solirubrobacter deserti TaxID=2282478 RepID=A0ABT4RMN3_9ACTN|nr:hypothetical protein [Solirubrobacter deserti]MBE2316984.1 hypothetical protein [Solirubrobacter deserti]MDA0139815.1 hypothetical protein [Solirubrobacter deserti]
MRWLVLLATVFVLLSMAVFAVLFVLAWISQDDRLFSPWVIGTHLFAFATTVALGAVYIRDVLRRGLDQEQKAMWGVLMGVFGPPVMLAYWWRHYRRPRERLSS